MIRIIIVLFVILLLIIIIKNMLVKKRKTRAREVLKFCKYCQSYVTANQECVNKQNNHEKMD